MYPDVVDLREFYENELGQLTRGLVRDACRRLWPDISGQALLGLGYATPYLRPFMQEASRTLAFMPAQQGVVWWPREGNLTALVEETHLPLATHAVDRIIMVHALENSDHIGSLLEEAWRVLAPQGRMIVIVPYRNGGYAGNASTPFGYGFSFSLQHLRRVLTHNRFQVERNDRAGFTPPWAYQLIGDASAQWVERNARRFLPALAGILLVEVSKQVYARPLRQPVRIAKQKPVLLPIPDLARPTTRTQSPAKDGIIHE